MSEFSHLDELEAEAIYIIREVAAECEKPVMLYSIGKDSSVMLHLAMKAFYPEKPPFPFLHVNTTWKFKEMIAFRDRIAKEKGCAVALFLDPKEHKYVDEFGTSNFFGITKDGVYATPDSPSILGSITNKSLQQIAEDLGMKVERRHIHRDELGNFAEIGACGTAVVITPISEIVTADKVFKYGEECGPTLQKLYHAMTGIQYGELPDTHGWMFEV